MDSFDAWLASLPFDRHPAWTTWVTAAIVTLIAYVIATVAMRVVARLTARHRGWSAFAAGVARPGCLLVAALAASLVLNAAPDDVPLIGGIRHVAALVVIAAFTWAAIGALRGMSAAIVVRHPTNLQDNLAARSVLGNLIAGLQIALTQPLRIDDVLIVAGEWGRVEEITSAFVVMALWDQRRLIVPLQYLIEQPFQNWTRRSAEILGTAFLWVDPTLPVAPLRAEAERICKSAPEWDGRVCVVQVTDMSEAAMQLRFLVSSADSGRNFDLRCKMREGVIAFIQQRHPDGLPRRRIDVEREPSFPRTRESSRDATTTRASR
jgi:hypothetical protein